MNFLFAIKLTSIILQGLIIYKFILKFLILSVALALNGNKFVLCKGNNSNNKMLKVYNFRIKSGIGKWSFHICILVFNQPLEACVVVGALVGNNAKLQKS